ncbi:radical SAM protein [Clostridium rectalis]|uniref:radical SAM protein n=1 Tax=Clostridium rectalis TaxID=2040295 RepID=UPI000F6391D2|nr:radical SAM protein [Clostridium rectalis]
MDEFKYIYGPIPSRRLGLSLGISTIPKKFCNYSCVYCQLGRTNNLTNKRQEFFPIKDILNEFTLYLKSNPKFDVVSLVGEGEPTLYSKMGELIKEIKKLTSKPVCVITNGGLINDINVSKELLNADIVLPSLNAFDENSFRKINRAYGKIKFQECYNGLVAFSKIYKGELWLEIMLVDGFNDDETSLLKLKSLADKINYSRIYINTCVRPPAESFIKPSSKEAINLACDILKGISIDRFVQGEFFSEILDNYHAILSIIKRHPMNHHEISCFLESRNCNLDEIDSLFKKLNNDKTIEVINYKGYHIYRLNLAS